MSSARDKPIEQLRLYSTAPHPCSYLDEEASTLFIDPEADIDLATFSYLNERGFRRSGPHIYKPSCLNCQACLSYRVLVDEFQFSKSQKRIIRRNQDLSIKVSNSIDTPSHYKLYEQYINSRHQDGDMYPASEEQFRNFLANHLGNTFYLEASLNQQLIAVAVIDECQNGLSAVYTFFDTAEQQRSLGQFMILQQLQLAARFELPYLYLGYWVKHSQKMAYKSRYRPAEIFLNQRWVQLNAS